ncbi:MAG: P1 family peptidase, partial [Chloroflexota bacterium]
SALAGTPLSVLETELAKNNQQLAFEPIDLGRASGASPTENADAAGGPTIGGIVATNARLNKEETNKVAQMAHNGLAMSVRPAHLMYDGDTIFSLATGAIESDVNVVGAFAAEVTAQAIRNGIRNSSTLLSIRAVE